MNNLFFDESIAEKIYNQSCDMDCNVDEETRESEILLINQALDKIYSYSSYNNDFLALYNSLFMIYSE